MKPNQTNRFGSVWFGLDDQFTTLLFQTLYSFVFFTIICFSVCSILLFFSNNTFHIIYFILYFSNNLQVVSNPYKTLTWFSLYHEICSLSNLKVDTWYEKVGKRFESLKNKTKCFNTHLRHSSKLFYNKTNEEETKK